MKFQTCPEVKLSPAQVRLLGRISAGPATIVGKEWFPARSLFSRGLAEFLSGPGLQYSSGDAEKLAITEAGRAALQDL